MASYDQMLTHYRMLGEQAQAQTDAQIRAQREAAALQSQRDAELFAQQQAQLGQQATLQAQRDQQLAGYQSQQQILAGQIGSARDYQGFQQQGALAGQQYEFTMQRDQQQAGVRAQEQVRQASLQEQLSQAQLNQREQMDMRRMEAAGAEVDQKVRGGYLTAEEGANLQMQIRTGLNPLRDRAMEADRLRSIVQTQGIEQQNEQQATLFARRQSVLAMNPQDRIREFRDPNGNRAMFQMNQDGDWTPLDFNAASRADQGMANNTAVAAQNIISSMGADARANTAAPIANANVAANTAQTLSQTENANLLAPLTRAQVEATTNSVLENTINARNLAPEHRRQVANQADLFYEEAVRVMNQNRANGRLVTDQEKERAMRLQTMGSALRYLELAEPPVSANGDFYRGIDGGWHPNQGPGLDRDRSERRIQAQRATFTHLTESVGRSMASEAREAMLESNENRRPAWMRSDAAYSAELQRRVGVQAQAVNNLLNPQPPRTPQTDAHGAPGITPQAPEGVQPAQQMQNFQAEMNAAANQNIPNVPLAQQREQMPQAINAATAQQLATVTTDVWDNLPLIDRGIHYFSLGRLTDLARSASAAGRALTAEERAEVARLLDTIQSNDPRIADRIRARMPGFTRRNVENPLQPPAPIHEGGPTF